MRRRARVVLLALLGPALLGLSPFEEAADPAGIARLRDYRLVRFSSADPVGGNDDHDHFLRQEGDLLVLAEAEGPGAIVRLWATSPAARGGDVFPGEALLFVDGADAPGLQLPLEELFGGRAPFVPPLAGYWAGGWTSFVPIPFARGVKVAVRGVEPEFFYYHVDLARYPDGTAVETFALPLAAGDAAALERMAAAWGAPPGPFASLGADREASNAGILPPGTGADLLVLDGGGVIAALEVALAPEEARSLPAVRLQVTVDGAAAPQVDALVADLFAAAWDPDRGQVVAFDSLALSVQPGRFRCYLPLPFAAGARLRLQNEADRPLLLTLGVRYAAGCPGPDLGRLHTVAAAGPVAAGVDWAVATVPGRGHLAGLVLQSPDCAGLECLEGDEHLRYDGAARIDGTGTEDYVGGGWYFNNGVRRLATATAGNPFLGGSSVTAFRFHFADPVPFRDGFAMTLEHGGFQRPNTTMGAYRTVAFLYRESPAVCGGTTAGGTEPPAGAGCSCRAAAGQESRPPWGVVLLIAMAAASSRSSGVVTGGTGRLPHRRQRSRAPAVEHPRRRASPRRGRHGRPGLAAVFPVSASSALDLRGTCTMLAAWPAHRKWRCLLRSRRSPPTSG
jgi:MYXO-CTERM domain-containing protein